MSLRRSIRSARCELGCNHRGGARCSDRRCAVQNAGAGAHPTRRHDRLRVQRDPQLPGGQVWRRWAATHPADARGPPERRPHVPHPRPLHCVAQLYGAGLQPLTGRDVPVDRLARRGAGHGSEDAGEQGRRDLEAAELARRAGEDGRPAPRWRAAHARRSHLVPDVRLHGVHAASGLRLGRPVCGGGGVPAGRSAAALPEPRGVVHGAARSARLRGGPRRHLELLGAHGGGRPVQADPRRDRRRHDGPQVRLRPPTAGDAQGSCTPAEGS